MKPFFGQRSQNSVLAYLILHNVLNLSVQLSWIPLLLWYLYRKVKLAGKRRRTFSPAAPWDSNNIFSQNVSLYIPPPPTTTPDSPSLLPLTSTTLPAKTRQLYAGVIPKNLHWDLPTLSMHFSLYSSSLPPLPPINPFYCMPRYEHVVMCSLKSKTVM